MSHKPPLPDAATSPYPAHPAPIEHSATDDAVDATENKADNAGSVLISARNIGLAAGAAIGSAAVAAALLFYNRPSPSTKRTPAKAPAKRSTKAKAPAARKPRSTAAKPVAKAAAAAKAAVKPVVVKAATKAPAKPRAKKAATPKATAAKASPAKPTTSA